MFSSHTLIAIFALFSCVKADSPSASSTSYSNASIVSSTSSSSLEIPSVCCFVIQETATEHFWRISSVVTETQDVTLTSVTSYLTPLRNGTVTNVFTNVYNTTVLVSKTINVGKNPITFYDNPVPSLIVEEETALPANVTAIVTGGVTVQSPAAFFVYSTVKIITAAPVTNADGLVQCGTKSSWDAPGLTPKILPTWPSVNSYAEAYFGGDGIAGDNQEPTATSTFTYTETSSGFRITNTATILQNETFYTNLLGFTIKPHNPFLIHTSSITEITLTAPFIYQPDEGKTGATDYTRCYESDDTVMYGYVPQTLVNLLASDSYYTSQYPAIASCLPGGPSMVRRQKCFPPQIPLSLSYQIPGGDISRTAVITVNPPGGDPESQTAKVQFGVFTASTPVGTVQPIVDGDPVKSSPGGPVGHPPQNSNKPATTQAPILSGPGNSPGNHDPASPQTSIGAIINSFVGGQGGSTVVITPPAGGVPIPVTLGSTTFVSGTPVFVIPSATTVPAADIPAGIGSTTLINGTPFVVIQPTTIPIPAGTGGQQIFSTTVIGGTPFLFIPGPTSIPITAAPSGLVGSTTTINGTPFLIIPSATSVPALPGQITIIDGTTFDIFNGATTVPVNPDLPLSGPHTVISGTTFVILTGATTVPVVTAGPSYVPVSSASRTTVSWIGFLMTLGRGFVARFR